MNYDITIKSPLPVRPGQGQSVPAPLTAPPPSVHSALEEASWRSPVALTHLGQLPSWVLLYGGQPGPPTPLAEGGGPIHRIYVELEEQVAFLRIHAICLVGRKPVPPRALRLILITPQQETVDFWWPDGDLIERLGHAHFAFDLTPAILGRWRFRWDAWGLIRSWNIGSFHVSLKHQDWMWSHEERGVVFPERPAIATPATTAGRPQGLDSIRRPLVPFPRR